MTEPDAELPRGRRSADMMRKGVPPLQDWPAPREEDIPVNRLRRYRLNKFAIELFHGGMSEEQVSREMHSREKVIVKRGTWWRMFERANRVNPHTGHLNGYWACIPHWRPQPVTAPSNHPAHELTKFFKKYPAVEAKLCTFVLTRRTGSEMRPVGMLKVEMVWKVFLAECKALELHLMDAEWPYRPGDERRGYEAVRRWFHGKKFENPSAAARNELPENVAKAVARNYRATAVPPPRTTIQMAYSRVEVDEHKMDAVWLSRVPGEKEGEWVDLQFSRLWALVMQETKCKLVLSTGVAFGPSYRTEDLLRLVHGALVPPPRYEKHRLSDPEWQYDNGAVFPAEMAELARNTWQQLAMDSHSVHRSSPVISAIETATRGEVSFDATGEPTMRPVIENFFKNIARGMLWVESALGNKPDSPARRNPEAGAMASLVYAPMAHEYLDMLGRNHNVTALKELGGDTPLQAALFMLERGQLFRSPVGEFGPANLHLFLPRSDGVLTRRGSSALGPIGVYSNYTYYSSAELAGAHELMLAKDLTVDLYVQEDARFAILIPRDRAFADRRYPVVCRGRWARNPHTLTHRMFVESRAAKRLFAGVSKQALMGVGLVRGLAAAGRTNEGLAQLLSGITAFMDRFGAGVVPYLSLEKSDIDRLLNFVEKTEGDELYEPASEDSTHAQPSRAATKGVAQETGPVPTSPRPSSPYNLSGDWT
jgi:hypothetical protein